MELTRPSFILFVGNGIFMALFFLYFANYSYQLTFTETIYVLGLASVVLGMHCILHYREEKQIIIENT